MKPRLLTLVGAVLVCVATVAVRSDAQVALPAPSRPVAPLPASPLHGGRTVSAEGLSPALARLAQSAVACAVNSGALEPPPTLTIIDYSKASTEPRLWVFDMVTGELLFRELVAHGRNTGENLAQHFSDAMNSRQSSLGLFRTDDTYTGSNGYSLRLDGLEPGFNGHARERAIVMHGAPYVDATMAAANGRLGRSWGCPALRSAIASKVIDTIRGGGVIFSYYPDSDWLTNSRFLNCQQAKALPTMPGTRRG